jgi:hypothetical protein
MAIYCPHCNEQLAPADAPGSTFARQGSGAMVCLSGQTAVVYSKSAIEEMKETSGICPECRSVPEEDRANLILQLRSQKKGAPRG